MTTEDIYDLIAKTSIELGLRTDGKSMAALAKLFFQDLQTDKRLNLSLEQVQTSFRLGVRYDEKEPFLNIRTFYRWCLKHKERINDARYQVETLHQNPNEVEYYPKNLLK